MNFTNFFIELAERGLVSFVGDGAILPRRSGDSDLPLTEGAMDLLQRCLTADPARRITFAEVQRHPWWLEQQALAAGAGSST